MNESNDVSNILKVPRNDIDWTSLPSVSRVSEDRASSSFLSRSFVDDVMARTW